MGRSNSLKGARLRGVRTMYLNGESYEKIGKKYDVNIKTVMRAIKDNQFDIARNEIKKKSVDITVDEFAKSFKLQMKKQVRELAPAINDFIGMLGKSIKSINEQFEKDPETAERRFRTLGGVKALDAIITLIGKTENEFEQKVVHKIEVPDNIEELGEHDIERLLSGEEIEATEYDVVDED